MVDMLNFDSELRELGTRMGLPELTWDEENACTLEIANSLALTMYLDHDAKSLVVYTTICRLLENTSKADLISLLSANFFWKDTGGATLGLESGSHMIFLSQALHFQALTVDNWDALLKNFIPIAKQWIAQSADFGAEAPDAHLSPMQISNMLRA